MADTEKKEQKWFKILSRTRDNYLKTFGVLSGFKEEFESYLNNARQKSQAFNDDTVNAIKEWIVKSENIQKEFQKLVRDRFINIIFVFPEKIISPYAEKIKKFIDTINKNMEIFFSDNPIFWFFKTK